MKKLDLVERQGGYDEEGRLVIPFDYVEIYALNDGVYYARKDFNEKSYDFYTAKGRVDYPGTITNVQWDEERNLLAVYGKDNTAEIVEVDYENNSLKTIYSNAITNLAIATEDLISMTCINGNLEIFSRKQKRVIKSFADKINFVEANEKGFVCQNETGKSFWNLSGEKIIDGFRDIKMYGDFLVVTDMSGLWGVYSYAGKLCIPCQYYSIDEAYGIIPFLMEIDGEKIWLFRVEEFINTHRRRRQKIIDIDNKTLWYTDKKNERFCILETGNVLLSAKKNDKLFKLEKNREGIITLKTVFEAKEITSLYGDLFEVRVGFKKGICNTDGELVEPLKFHK